MKLKSEAEELGGAVVGGLILHACGKWFRKKYSTDKIFKHNCNAILFWWIIFIFAIFCIGLYAEYKDDHPNAKVEQSIR